MERAILIHFDTATGEVKIEAEGFEGLIVPRSNPTL